jgi:cell division septum initiation protein DivIVA
MSDFVHDPTPAAVVVNTPEGSVVVTQETSDMVHRTAEQTAEVIELQTEHAEALTELQEKHMEDNAKVEEGTPLEPTPIVHYRATTPEQDKNNVESLFRKGEISEEERDARFAEIDKIAEERGDNEEEAPMVDNTLPEELDDSEEGTEESDTESATTPGIKFLGSE